MAVTLKVVNSDNINQNKSKLIIAKICKWLYHDCLSTLLEHDNKLMIFVELLPRFTRFCIFEQVKPPSHIHVFNRWQMMNISCLQPS